MGRPSNPFGDPVAVRRTGSVFKLRYYPTGVITKSADRKELPGVYRTKEAAQDAAAVLRARLVKHRNRYLPDGDRGNVLLSTAAAEFVEVSRRAADAQAIPIGTYRNVKSKMEVYISPVVRSRDLLVKDLHGKLADDICTSVGRATKADGSLKGDVTVSGGQTVLRNFGAWLVSEGYLSEYPFAALNVDSKAMAAERKERARVIALAQLTSDNFRSEDDSESGLSLSDVPSLAVVSALSDAIFRRETCRAVVPNSRLRPLSDEVARQIAALPLFQTATGLRHCESLAVHTSRINVEGLTIGVDRQLVRAAGWAPGTAPQLAPPKYDRKRIAHVWPMFAERLRELVEWADANTDGWLFAPPRADRWWTENCDDMWERAVKLLASEHAASCEGPGDERHPLWTWRAHFTRHAYGSYSLAPQTSGGLGWSLTMVAKSMGHANEATTQRIYRHAIDDELLTVKRATIEWPGLSD